MAVSREELDKSIAEKKLGSLSSEQKTVLKWLVAKALEGKPITLEMVMKNYSLSAGQTHGYLDRMDTENLLHFKLKVASDMGVVSTNKDNPYIVVTGIGQAAVKLMKS